MWSDKPASSAVVLAFTGAATKAYFPGVSDDVFADLMASIMSACYTEEELLWAAERLKYDEKLDQAIQAKTQNPFFLLPPIDRIIKRSRQIRRQLAEGLLSEWDVSKLVQDVPELSWSDFQRGGFDYEDRPLYRYAPGASVSEEARAMQLLHGRGNE